MSLLFSVTNTLHFAGFHQLISDSKQRRDVVKMKVVLSFYHFLRCYFSPQLLCPRYRVIASRHSDHFKSDLLDSSLDRCTHLKVKRLIMVQEPSILEKRNCKITSMPLKEDA